MEAGKRSDRASLRVVIGGAASGVLWSAFVAYLDIMTPPRQRVDLEFIVTYVIISAGFATGGAFFGLLAVIGFRLITRRRS